MKIAVDQSSFASAVRASRPECVTLSGVNYLAGPLVELESWCSRNRLPQEDVAHLQQMGFRMVAEAPADRTAMLAESMQAAIDGSSLRASDITAVCFAPPSFEWSRELEGELLEALVRLDLHRLPIVGIGLQGCSALGAAVETASAFAISRRGPVLVVLSALPAGGVCFHAPSRRLFSCGVASAVLAPGGGRYALRGSAFSSDLGLVEMGNAAAPTFNQSWRHLRSVIDQLLTASALVAADVSFVCGSNVSEQALMAIGMAANVPRERVWRGGLREVGHLYSADALVALSLLEDDNMLHPGNIVLLIEWSEWTISAAFLQKLF